MTENGGKIKTIIDNRREIITTILCDFFYIIDLCTLDCEDPVVVVELGGCLAPEDEGDAAASATRVSKHQLPLLQISEIIWRIPSKGSMDPPPSPPPQNRCQK